MSDFSAFKVPERQFSDITQSLAPVEDTSKGMGMSALAEGVSDLATMGGQAYRQYELDLKEEARIAKADSIAAAKAEAKKLEVQYNNEYDQVLTTAAQSVKSGEWTKQQARTYIMDKRKELRAQGADTAELDKKESGFHKTILGKPLAEKSLEEKAFEEVTSAYMKDPAYYDPYADSETNEKNFKRWLQRQKDDAAYKEKIGNLDLELKERNLSAARRKELEDEKRLEQEEKLAQIAQDLPNRFKTGLKNVVSEAEAMYNSGEVDEAGRVLYIQQGVKAMNNKYKIEIAQARTISGLNELAEVSNEMVDNLASLAIENVSKTGLIEALDNEANLMTATTGNAILASSANLKTVGGVNRYLPGLAGLELSSAGTKDINSFASNLANGLPNNFSVPSGDKEKAQSVKNYFKVISNNIDLIGSKDNAGRVKVRKADVVDQVSDVIRYLDRAGSNGDALASSMTVVEQLAYGKVGKFLKDNATFFEPEVQQAAKEAIATYTNKVSGWANAELQGILSDEEKVAAVSKATSPRDKIAQLKKTTTDDLELTVFNGVVQFVGKSAGAKRIAEEANKKVSKHLTTVVKASATITGESMDRTLDNQKSIIWPAKYGVEEEQQEVFETQDGTKATPVQENVVYMDENGDLFKIVNGEKQVL